MAEEGKMIRVAEDDPTRCISIGSLGQCRMKSEPGVPYCIMHGRGAIAARDKREVNSYHLTVWQAKLDKFKQDPEIKSLRSEIGICRMVLENIVNKCPDEDQLFLYSNKIKEMLTVLEKLIVSCSKLEITNNQLLDRDKVLIISQVMIQTVGEFVTDPLVLEKLANQLTENISKVINDEYIAPVEEPESRSLAPGFLEGGFDEEECDDGESLGSPV